MHKLIPVINCARAPDSMTEQPEQPVPSSAVAAPGILPAKLI